MINKSLKLSLALLATSLFIPGLMDIAEARGNQDRGGGMNHGGRDRDRGGGMNHGGSNRPGRDRDGGGGMNHGGSNRPGRDRDRGGGGGPFYYTCTAVGYTSQGVRKFVRGSVDMPMNNAQARALERCQYSGLRSCRVVGCTRE